MITITEHIVLADKTWFKTGGPARFYAEPTNAHEFAEAIQFACERTLPLFILGHGANILISDHGFPGLVIRPRLLSITIHEHDQLVTAAAGVGVQDLIDHCIVHHHIGLEEFSGIPGTVGGSVYINIHYFEFLLDQFLVKARVIHHQTGQIEEVTREWFGFGYNTSRLLSKDYYLVDATFRVTKVSPEKAAYAQGRRDEIIRHRRQRYPAERTCGSFFRNFLPHELGAARIEKPLPYIAFYLDNLGVKGQLSFGGASVSRHHANMIVTGPDATSADVIALARAMQQRVKDRFGLLPQAECQFIGFKGNPLLEI